MHTARALLLPDHMRVTTGPVPEARVAPPARTGEEERQGGVAPLWKAFATAVRPGADPKKLDIATLHAFPIALEEGALTPAWARLPPSRRRDLVERYVQRTAAGPDRVRGRVAGGHVLRQRRR